MADKKSVRLQILEAMVDTFRKVNDETPVGDPYGVTFGRVGFGPVDERDHTKRFALGVNPGPERNAYQYPFIMTYLTVNVEYRATINRDDDSPLQVLEQVLTVVKRVLHDNQTWGGLALNTKVLNTEVDLMTYSDRSTMGVCVTEVQFRHSEEDPRSTAPAFG